MAVKENKWSTKLLEVAVLRITLIVFTIFYFGIKES